MPQARFPGGGRGKQGEYFNYEWFVKLPSPDRDYPRRLFAAAARHFAGQKDVLGAFDDEIAHKNPGSFGAWLAEQGISPGYHGCYIAAILCEEYGVSSRLEGPHQRVLLTFPRLLLL